MNRRKFIFWIGGLGLILWLAVSFLSNPVAHVRVVDAVGKPVAGACIRGEGLGTRPGPGAHGWRTANGWGVANPPRVTVITTDRNGFASVPYPSHLTKSEMTGSIKLLVDHPDFVPNHYERVVAMTVPFGLNWNSWSNYVAWRFSQKDPIVLQKGVHLIVRLRENSPGPRDAPLYIQVAGWEDEDTNVWIHPGPGIVATHRLPAGAQKIRAVAFDTNNYAWFSDVLPINALGGQTNEVVVTIKKAATVHGKLDGAVPRPIVNGRVTASVRPKDAQGFAPVPRWQTWAKIGADGTFEIGSLPPGVLELLAVCDGYVSPSAKGEFPFYLYPEKYDLETNDISIALAMEATATLDVEVRDNRGRLVKDALVSACPVISFAGENSVIVGVDCFHTAELIRDGRVGWAELATAAMRAITNYRATTDKRGRVLIRNLPVEVSLIHVQHDGYVLPTIEIEPVPKPTRYNLIRTRQKLRMAKVSLVPSQTNYTVVRLERRE